MMIQTILLVSIVSMCHGVTKDSSVQEEIAQLREQIKKLTKVVHENHEKQEETAKRVDTFTKNTNEYCSMLPEGVCGPCQCKDDRRLDKQFYCNCQNLPTKRDCLQYYIDGVRINGLYRIHQNNLRIIQVFCDQSSDGGGWTVFQRRLDGTINFYRNWANYKRGFGDIQHEFWLGNENLFTMSLQGLYPAGSELRVELEDWEGSRRYAKYSSFQVGNEKTSYQMYLSGYSGTAGDGGSGLSYHSGMKFTTFDKDNDKDNDNNCAISYLGGWWYNNCLFVNLNGKYYDFAKWGASYTGVSWRMFHDYEYSLKKVEMKMRRKTEGVNNFSYLMGIFKRD